MASYIPVFVLTAFPTVFDKTPNFLSHFLQLVKEGSNLVSFLYSSGISEAAFIF